MNVRELFLDLVSYPSASDESAVCTPSTPGQKVLGARIVSLMKEIGIEDAFLDEKGYVYGSIPATDPREHTIGFIAHMDTYGGVSGEQVGKTLITTDGTTLLGGDDKAGIAEILVAAEELIQEKKPHGSVKIAFTPDEEIGAGAEYFDVKGFGCDYAYTVDGGGLGELEYENFNAASAVVEISGLSIHTGAAKGKLVNSMSIAMEFCGLLPQAAVPELSLIHI